MLVEEPVARTDSHSQPEALLANARWHASQRSRVVTRW
jgi:hypothetical protein